MITPDRRLALVAGTALTLAVPTAVAGCKHGPRPVCTAEVASPSSDEAEARSLTPRAWFASLMRSYEPGANAAGDPTTDCLRRQVRWSAAPKGCALPERFVEGDELLPAAPLTPEDLVVAPAPDDQLLVWAIARRYRGGDGLGPIALVRWNKRGIDLMAIGNLRAGTRNPSFWIDALDGGSVLVVESERCAGPDACTPTLQLMPIFGGFITPAPLTDGEGRCLGPARFDRRRTLERERESGELRGFTLNTDVQLMGDRVRVDEQVIVRDRDPEAEAEDGLAREFRRVDDSYVIHLDRRARVFVAEQSSLWERVLVEDARLDGAGADGTPGDGGEQQRAPAREPPSSPNPAPTTER